MTSRAWFPRTTASALLALAILLRLVGIVVNNEANDPHLEVSQIMAYQHRIPAATEVWEANQPKLYHASVALLLRVLPQHLRGTTQVRVAQAVSCAAGILTLLILRVFLSDLPLSVRARQIAFALVALNPKMIATSIQATNDAFVILFGAIAIAAGYRFFNNFGRRDFALMAAGVVLACISKGNGLPVAIAIAGAFVAALLKPTVARSQILGFATLTLLVFVAIVPIAGEYWSRYQQTGNAFWISQEPSPPPHFLEPSYPKSKRPGITSVVSGYFTFRLLDLLKEPLVTNDPDVYPPHRTSLWSFVYGSAHSNHFDYYPQSWQSDSAGVLWLLRATWILALIPTALLGLGVLRGTLRTAAAGFSRVASTGWSAEVLLAAAAAGYVIFLMAYCYKYRDFATMKPIFLYPAVAAYVAYYAREVDRLDSRGVGVASKVAYGSAVLLCAAYVVDTAILLVQLLALRLHLT